MTNTEQQLLAMVDNAIGENAASKIKFAQKAIQEKQIPILSFPCTGPLKQLAQTGPLQFPS